MALWAGGVVASMRGPGQQRTLDDRTTPVALDKSNADLVRRRYASGAMYGRVHKRGQPRHRYRMCESTRELWHWAVESHCC
jgi:hypothetical protein